MSSRGLKLLGVSSIGFYGSLSFAFDPVSVAMGAQAVSSVMKGMEKADEAAEIGFALGDLMSDLEIASEGDSEMKDAVRKIELLSSKAKDLQWSRDDIRGGLDDDLKRAGTLSDKLKALRNLIIASKKIAAVIGVRPKGAEKAARVQDLRVNAMILDELQAMRRAQFLAYLEKREIQNRREIFMQEIIEQQRASLNGPGNRARGGKR